MKPDDSSELDVTRSSPHRWRTILGRTLLASSLAVAMVSCGGDDDESPDEIEQEIDEVEDDVEDELDEVEDELRDP